MNPMFLQIEDIQRRLYFRKRHWTNGSPSVSLFGKPKSFGILSLDFGDERIRWNIYLGDWESINKILNVTKRAIETFSQFEAN